MLAAATAAVAAVALWSDWCWRIVPHWVVATLLGLWLVACIFVPGSSALGGGVLASVLCGAAALLAGFALHAFGWLGAGDGKLLAVMALWLGPGDLPLALFGTVAIGLVLLAVAWARPEGEFRARGIPFAWAIVPPSATVLLARAVAV